MAGKTGNLVDPTGIKDLSLGSRSHATTTPRKIEKQLSDPVAGRRRNDIDSDSCLARPHDTGSLVDIQGLIINNLLPLGDTGNRV